MAGFFPEEFGSMSLWTTLVFMDHRLQQTIIKRLGLFGESESTWN
jgi:hypothetical protein